MLMNFMDLVNSLRKKLFSRADPISDASYFAYIYERLFSTFIATHQEIKALNYRYSEAEIDRARRAAR